MSALFHKKHCCFPELTHFPVISVDSFICRRVHWKCCWVETLMRCKNQLFWKHMAAGITSLLCISCKLQNYSEKTQQGCVFLHVQRQFSLRLKSTLCSHSPLCFFMKSSQQPTQLQTQFLSELSFVSLARSSSRNRFQFDCRYEILQKVQLYQVLSKPCDLCNFFFRKPFQFLGEKSLASHKSHHWPHLVRVDVNSVQVWTLFLTKLEQRKSWSAKIAEEKVKKLK